MNTWCETVQKMEFSTPDLTWQEHGLEEYPMLYNAEDSGHKAIVKNGQLVSIVRKGYKLLPNEEAVIVADQAAKMAELVPFSDFAGPWYDPMDDHVIRDKHQVHALYTLPGSYTVDTEEMYLGVGVHNSIDGSLGFGCGIFTFRHACSNMVWAGMRGYVQGFDDRRTLEYIYHKHTKNLVAVADGLLVNITRVMDRAQGILDAYKQMAKVNATQELIERLRSSHLSKKCLPDYIADKEASLPDLSQWNVYNDVTQAIWHNKDTTMFTKKFYYRALHGVIPLKVVA